MFIRRRPTLLEDMHSRRASFIFGSGSNFPFCRLEQSSSGCLVTLVGLVLKPSLVRQGLLLVVGDGEFRHSFQELAGVTGLSNIISQCLHALAMQALKIRFHTSRGRRGCSIYDPAKFGREYSCSMP